MFIMCQCLLTTSLVFRNERLYVTEVAVNRVTWDRFLVVPSNFRKPINVRPFLTYFLSFKKNYAKLLSDKSHL